MSRELADPSKTESQRCRGGDLVGAPIVLAGLLALFYVPGSGILEDFKAAIWARPSYWLLLASLFVLHFYVQTWAYELMPYRIRPPQAAATSCRLACFYMITTAFALMMSWLITAGIAIVADWPTKYAVMGHTLWVTGIVSSAVTLTIHAYTARSSRS